MSQHDYSVANQSPALVRADFNNALLAIASNNSGATAPGSPVAYQWWLDTANNLLKVRNAANSAWITVGTPSVSNLGFLTLSGGSLTGQLLAAAGLVGAPGISFSGDTDSGFYWVSSNTWGLVSNGVEYLRISPSGITFMGTGATTLPSGTTAERPVSPANGMMRYSTTNSVIEIYVNGNWRVLASPSSYPFTVEDFADKVDFSFGANGRQDYLGNGTSRSAFTQFPFTSPSLLTAPGTAPTGAAESSSFSPNGEFLAVAHTTTPFVSIYQRNGDGFVKLANPGTLPTGNANHVAWSPDSQFLAVTHATTPFLTVYQRNGSTFTKLTNPSVLPAGTCNGAEWSPNGQLLAIAQTSSPFLAIYELTGTTLTSIPPIWTAPAGLGTDVSWSGDGRFLAVSHTTTPFVTIYERTSSYTFTKLSNPASLPAGNANGVSFSPDMQFLAVGHATSPFLTVYQRSGSIFTKLTNPSTLPGFTSNKVSFSPSGRYLAVPVSVNSNLVYEISGTTFTSTGVSIGSDALSLEWSPDSQYLTRADDNSPFLRNYKTASNMAEKSLLVLNKIFRSGT